MSERRYDNVVKAVMEHPWVILPEYLAVIREVVMLRAAGEPLTRDEIRERVGVSEPRRGGYIDRVVVQGRRGGRGAARSGGGPGGVAVIPVSGVITPRADMFSDISGGTSVEAFRQAFREAMADPDIGAIVLDVDSPGGRADLLPELAQTMRELRGRKPVVSVSDTLMASAAYWIGSQADEVYASPSALAGSIGVYATHQDLSAAQEQLGVRTTFIKAGKFKTEGNPYEPLSEDAAAHIQEIVDETYGMFTADVAKGRRAPVADVRTGYGEGRLLTASAAVSAGLADKVATLEESISRAADLAAGAPPLTAAGTSASIVVPVDVAAGPIAVHSTETSDGPWDGPAAKANLANDKPETFHLAFAWEDSSAPDPDGDGHPDRKGDYKGIHHEVSSDGEVGAANLTACSQVIGELNGGRGGFPIPQGDRKGVWDHVARHLRDGGKEPPPLKSLQELEQSASGAGDWDGSEEPAGGDGSFAERVAALVREAEALQGDGRPLTAAKLELLVELRARLGELIEQYQPQASAALAAYLKAEFAYLELQTRS